MFQKFLGISDEMLVQLIRNGDDDAETELFERYRVPANKLGRRIFHRFRTSINCEAEDLCSIALNATFIAANKFEEGGSFFVYWSIVAENEIMNVVKAVSDSYMSNNKFSFVSMDEIEEDIGFMDSDIKVESRYEKLLKVIYSKKINCDKASKDMFVLRIEGYSVKDIAKMYNMKEASVRYKIEKLIEKLKKLVLHS